MRGARRQTGAKPRMLAQTGAAGSRAAQATQKARERPRRPERGLLLRSDGPYKVQIDRVCGRRRKLRLQAEAGAALPAGIRQGLAEVAHQAPRVTPRLGDEGAYPLEPLQIPQLALLKLRVQALERLSVVRRTQLAIAVHQPAGLDIDRALLLEVVEGAHRALSLLDRAKAAGPEGEGQKGTTLPPLGEERA